MIEMRPTIDPPGFMVDSEGVVYTSNYGSVRGQPWRPMKLKLRGSYLIVLLRFPGGKRVCRPVHRLVLDAFVGPRPAGMVCCHWDGNPLNNRLDNLRWDTHKANMADSLRHGTFRTGRPKSRPDNRGERNGRAVLTPGDVLSIRKARAEGETIASLAQRFGARKEAIRSAATGKTWRHLQ